MFMVFLLALRKNKIMNIKNRIWQNILWQNIDPESNFITKIEFFDDKNGSPRCKYDYQDKTNIIIYCGQDVINDVLRIDLGSLGHYKVIIDKNSLKLIQTDSFFQDHEMHVFIAGNS